MDIQQGKYKISINRELCIGCMSCADTAPKIFEMDEEMKSRVRTDTEIDLTLLLTAAEGCAVNAITVIDTETGEQLWPK